MLQATGQHATYVHRECIQVLCLCGRTTGWARETKGESWAELLREGTEGVRGPRQKVHW